MGLTERRERERQEMRDLILDATLELFKERGYEQTTMRGIAEKIEYSAAAIYPYFKEKDELFFALHKRGFDRMAEQFAPLRQVADPYERLRMTARLYLDFALAEPAYYDLMFLATNVGERISQFDKEQEPWKEGCNAFGLLRETISQCMERGAILPGDPDVVAFVFWSQVHGMVSSHIRGRLVVIPPEKREGLIDQALDYFMRQNNRSTNEDVAN